MGSEPNAAWLGSRHSKMDGVDVGPKPMQWHIIKALAGLPMIEMAPVMMMQGRSILMEARGRVLSSGLFDEKGQERKPKNERIL